MWKLQIFIMLVSVRQDAKSNIIDDFRQMCPYNDLCTVGKMLTFNDSIDYLPCCSDCFCDEDCKKFHDCCPDVKGGIVTSPTMQCTTTAVDNPARRNLPDGVAERIFLSLRMTSSCSKDFTGNTTIIDMCAEIFENYPSSDDMVIVSNRYHHDDIYKNKYCASCNGVQETIRWHFYVASCPNVWNGSTTFSELKELIWKTCILYSSPPEHLQFSRPLFDCGLQLKSTCTDTNSVYKSSCELGPYTPVHVTSVLASYVYKNPFCYLCRKEMIPFSNSCPKSLHTINKDSVKRRISMLIRADTEASATERYSSGKTECNERQIFDWIEDRCRTLSCPWNSVVFYGRCLKFSDLMSNVVVSVKLLFRSANSDQALGELVRYSANDKAMIASSLGERFGFKDCEVQDVSVLLYTDKAIDSKFFLLITLHAFVSQECSFDFIVKNTRKLAAQSHTMFVSTKDDVIPMTGQMYFAETSHIFNESLYDKEVIASQIYGTLIPVSVTRFYICPFLKLKLSEYNSLMTKLGLGSETLAHINATSLVYNGFYVLSDDVIAVCVDTYFNLNEKKGINGVNDATVKYSYNYIILTGAWFICHCIFLKQIDQF